MHMIQNSERLCYNCFRERPDSQENPDGKGPCPYCGFQLEENAEEYPVALRAGTVLNHRYIIGRVLGQGGFGITYLAYDTSLATKVAVKEYMPGELSARMKDGTVSVMTGNRQEEFFYGLLRFQEEAHTLAKFMGQPGIAGVTDYFDENDTSYFVMDYIEGISFKTYIANQGGKITIEEALDVMIPVLRALTAVHREGLIHRDVTPDNIYITKDGDVKLLDFGSARYSLGDRSKSLDVVLKVGYAPKEQYIRRSRQGPYTDVYSCAACLYAAITGFLPPESLERLDHDTLIPPSEAGVEIPLYLERAILKGLAVQPEDRFQTAAEFLEAIESQQVVELSNEPHSSENQKTKRKGNALFLTGGIAAAAAVFFVVGSMFGISGPKTENAMSGTEGTAGVEKAEEIQEEILTAPTVMIGGEAYSTALTQLDLREKGLEDADLQGLKEMTNLELLDLRGNEMSDLSLLSGMTHLKELNLGDDIGGNTDIHDLSPLSGLTSLKVLHLPSENIEDLSPLSGLTGLEDLALIGDSGFVDDIEPLASLVNLKELYLKIGIIEDLSPLAEMTKLESLRIRAESYVSDLSPLAGMTHLKELELPAPQFPDAVDISPLSGLTELASLRMGCNVQDLSPLANLHNLQTIHLRDRQNGSMEDSFHTLEPLSELTNLTSLEMRSDYVTDLSPLSGLTKLEILNLSVPEVTDLSPLEGLTNLKSVQLEGGSITDWSPLDHVPNVAKN